MLKLYNTLTGSPAKLGLTSETVKLLTTPYQDIPVDQGDGTNLYFGQGIGVREYPNSQTRSVSLVPMTDAPGKIAICFLWSTANKL